MSGVKPVCFYLPQFHRTPENDRWWGEGFTEWTSSGRARPLFPGHAQPMRPRTPFGAYDLLDRRVRAWQGEVARAYGIHAFCWYHYWFRGKRLLEAPLERMLEDGAPDLPFMVCWANEPWTRRWTGLERDVLQSQEYGDEADWDAHFDLLLRFFRHPRYVCVDGRPVFLVYRPGHIPCLSEMVARWRARAAAEGLPGLHLVAVLGSFDDNGAVPPEADAACEFLPARALRLGMHGVVVNGVRVLTAEHAWQVSARAERPHPVFYRGAFAAWDNTPRSGNGGLCYLPLSRARFTDLLTQRMREVAADASLPAPFLFVNAWNEWAEGAYLEPDEAHGYARLEAIRDALERARVPESPRPSRLARVVLRVGDDASPREGAVTIACDPLHPELGRLAEGAAALVLDVLEPPLVDLLRARHARGLPSYLAPHLARLPAGTPPSVVRVRVDLLRHALRFAALGEPPTVGDLSMDLSTLPVEGDVARLGRGEGGEALAQALALDDRAGGLLSLLQVSDRWPSSLPALRQLVRRLNDLALWEAAAQHASRGLSASPRDPELVAELGRAWFRGQRSADAATCLKAAVTAAPWHLRGWQYLLGCLRQLPDEDAPRLAAAVVEAHPSNWALALLAVRVVPPSDRASLLERVAEVILSREPAPDERVDMAMAFGEACLALGDAALFTPQGARLAARLSAAFPTSARLADLEGRAWRACGGQAEAVQAFARAARIRREARIVMAESGPDEALPQGEEGAGLQA